MPRLFFHFSSWLVMLALALGTAPVVALSITHIFSPHNDAQLDVDKAG